MIVLGIILLLLGWFIHLHILWVIGLIVLIVGVVLFIVGATGQTIAGRRYWF